MGLINDHAADCVLQAEVDRARAALDRHPDNPLVAEVAGFILTDSARSFTVPV